MQWAQDTRRTTNNAIWIEDPIATPMETSMRFFIANMTADACSAAFPATGMMMTPMKTLDTPQLDEAPWRAQQTTEHEQWGCMT